jgi:hypothetical protein
MMVQVDTNRSTLIQDLTSEPKGLLTMQLYGLYGMTIHSGSEYLMLTIYFYH